MSQSLAKQCNELKERYDSCFLKWYSEKYLRGQGSVDTNECSALFSQYSNCLQTALKERGIDKLLEDAREDNKDNDAAFLGKKKCKALYIDDLEEAVLKSLVRMPLRTRAYYYTLQTLTDESELLRHDRGALRSAIAASSDSRRSKQATAI